MDSEFSIRSEIERIFNERKQDFGKGGFYQSFEPLGWDGQRKTQLRFEAYALEKFFSKDHDVLDAGCNSGFFANFLSPFVKSVDGFDNNASLIKMANTLARYLKNANATFHVSDFSSFIPRKKYDLVMACALHQWIKLNEKDFCDTIRKWLKDGSYVLVESHQIDKDKQYDKIIKYLKTVGFQNKHKGTTVEKVSKRNRKIKRAFSLWKMED